MGVPGVIGNSASFVSLVYKELLKDSLQNKEDPRAVPIPWNDEVSVIPHLHCTKIG